MQVHTNYNLQAKNSFGIEAIADYCIELETPEDIEKALIQYGPPLYVLGEGSNILITRDLQGVIWCPRFRGITQNRQDNLDKDTISLTIGAGENINDLVMYTTKQGWRGLENLVAIPGCMGAAPIQNIGAYGVEIKDLFVSCHAYDFEKSELVTLSKEQCHFGYRDSIFKQHPGRYLIIDVTLALSTHPHPIITYGGVQDTLIKNGYLKDTRSFTKEQKEDTTEVLQIEKTGNKGNVENNEKGGNSTQNIAQDNSPTSEISLTPAQIAETIAEIRWSKLPNPMQLGNAGSFFKNPIIENTIVQRIIQAHPDASHFPIENTNKTKIPAARLIEHAGLKGYREGNVGTYENQPLVIVNHGGATGQEIYDFSEKIIQGVFNTFGVTLEREVNVW